MKRLRPLLGAVLATLVVTALTPVVRSETGSNGVDLIERWSLDWRFRLRGPRAPAPELVLVVFDDATADRAPRLFEHRAGWAKVLHEVSARHPKVIGIDAVFSGPEALLGAALQDRVTQWASREGERTDETSVLLGEVARELTGDAALAAEIKAAGNVTLILHAGQGTSEALGPGLGKARYGQSTRGALAPHGVDSIIASRPEFVAAAKGMGFATVAEDETRTVRRLSFARASGDAIYMPFTLPLIAVARGVGRGELAYLGPQREVRLGDTAIALDDDSAWIDFPGPAGTVPTWSALDVIEGRVPAGAFEDKVVLLGVTRLGYDSVRTPFGMVPGVEIQAAAADNLLRNAWLRRTSPAVDLALVFALGLAAALLVSTRRLTPLVQVTSGLALLGGWLAFGAWALAARALWVPWVMPGVGISLSLLTGLALSYASEAMQRRQLKKAFGHYVGDDVLDELVRHPEKLALGGEKRTLSVLFSDIRDFTTLSEKLSPVELVTFLNTYLSPMTRAVLAQGGLLDKYIGDAVMGVFGAPVPSERHAAMALQCVLEMHRELDALNAGPLQRFGLHVAIGVGVNTGDMVVGNMGSAERFDYTVAGDSVNLASRLEGLSKVYGVFCLVGDATRRAAGDGFHFRELDLVQVKGKHEAVPVHELLSGPGRTVSSWPLLEAWEAGLAAFRAGKLPAARHDFGRFAAANPGDLAVQRYLERLSELPDEAPDGFSAVTAFKTK